MSPTTSLTPKETISLKAAFATLRTQSQHQNLAEINAALQQISSGRTWKHTFHEDLIANGIGFTQMKDAARDGTDQWMLPLRPARFWEWVKPTLKKAFNFAAAGGACAVVSGLGAVGAYYGIGHLLSPATWGDAGSIVGSGIVAVASMITISIGGAISNVAQNRFMDAVHATQNRTLGVSASYEDMNGLTLKAVPYATAAKIAPKASSPGLRMSMV